MLLGPGRPDCDILGLFLQAIEDGVESDAGRDGDQQGGGKLNLVGRGDNVNFGHEGARRPTHCGMR
jgi:hypothetical protein